MGAPTLLADLKSRGFRLAIDGNRLLVAPTERLTERDREQIREHRGALLALLTAPSPAANSMPSPSGTIEAHRLWLVTDVDGARWSVSYCPPATLAEVRERWPDARAIEPEAAPTGPLARDDESTIRACRIEAPAASRRGSLWPWPDFAVRCDRHMAATRCPESTATTRRSWP